MGNLHNFNLSISKTMGGCGSKDGVSDTKRK